MIKLAANLSMLFQDRPFLDRFDAAADAGFRGVEYLFPYEAPAKIIADKLRARDLTQVLFNTPAGDWAAGERGLGALPGRVEEFRDGVQRALEYARALGCKKLHTMAGIPPSSVDPAEADRIFSENVAYAARAAAEHGIEILLEPINSRIDMPGYFLNRSRQAVAIIEHLGLPNVRLQFDIYHMQIMEGDLARSMQTLKAHIAHVQVADNPGRNEPGTGEINYPWLLHHLDSIGYAGWVGCEYRPKGDTVAGLGWAKDYFESKSAERAVG